MISLPCRHPALAATKPHGCQHLAVLGARLCSEGALCASCTRNHAGAIATPPAALQTPFLLPVLAAPSALPASFPSLAAAPTPFPSPTDDRGRSECPVTPKGWAGMEDVFRAYVSAVTCRHTLQSG